MRHLSTLEAVLLLYLSQNKLIAPQKDILSVV